LSAPAGASVCAILAGEKKIIPGPPFITRAMSWFGLVWVIEFALPYQILSETHSSINFDDFCDNRVTIVDQRVTDPSGSEKVS